MECVRVILMTSFFSDEINLKMTANNDNRLRGSLPEIITKRIVGECSSSVTDSTLSWWAIIGNRAGNVQNKFSALLIAKG